VYGARRLDPRVARDSEPTLKSAPPTVGAEGDASVAVSESAAESIPPLGSSIAFVLMSQIKVFPGSV
jgi:hypothetical protein